MHLVGMRVARSLRSARDSRAGAGDSPARTSSGGGPCVAFAADESFLLDPSSLRRVAATSARVARAQAGRQCAPRKAAAPGPVSMLHLEKRRGRESNPRIEVLQTPTLPLGYPAELRNGA